MEETKNLAQKVKKRVKIVTMLIVGGLALQFFYLREFNFFERELNLLANTTKVTFQALKEIDSEIVNEKKIRRSMIVDYKYKFTAYAKDLKKSSSKMQFYLTHYFDAYDTFFSPKKIESINHLILQLDALENLISSDRKKEAIIIDEIYTNVKKLESLLDKANKKASYWKNTLDEYKLLLIWGGILGLCIYIVGLVGWGVLFFVVRESRAIRPSEDEQVSIVSLGQKDFEQKGLWECFTDTDVTRWSDSLGLLFDVETVVDSTLDNDIKFFLDNDQETLRRSIELCKSDLLPFDLELQIKTSINKIKWVKFSGWPYLKSGVVDKISGVLEDVTKEKSALYRYNLLYENSPHFIVTLREDKVIDCNEAARRILELTHKDEVVGLAPSILFPLYQLDGQSSVNKLVDSINISEELGQNKFNILFQTKERKEIPLEVTCYPIEVSGVRTFLLIGTSLAIKMEFERKLVHSNTRTQNALKLRVESISNIYSVIRNFRDSIEGSTDFEQIEREAESLECRVNSFIDYSDDEVRSFSSESFNFSLKEHVKMILGPYLFRAKKLEIPFEIKFHKKIPEVLWGDPLKIHQILRHILDNTFQHAREGDVAVLVGYQKVDTLRSKILFKVQDGGPGISKRTENDIFSFETNITFDYEGKGMKKEPGLVRCRKLIESMNGEIYTEPSPLGGVTFSFYVILDEIAESEILLKPISSGNKRSYLAFSLLREEYIGGEDILMNIISDFIAFCPEGIKKIENAILEKDSDALEVAASSFYGVVGHFHADNLIEKAIVLEKMGRFRDFKNAQKALDDFKEELDLLIKGLQNMNLSDLVA